MKTDQEIEQAIQDKGLTAPRVTMDDIKRVIVHEFYFTARQGVDGADIERVRAESPNSLVTLDPKVSDPDISGTTLAPLELLTFCVLVLRNGFTVTGESACASPENFDAGIGRDLARNNAVNKVWQLEGYLLKERLHQASFPPIDEQPVKSMADSVSELG